jgi:hypothetical protein
MAVAFVSSTGHSLSSEGCHVKFPVPLLFRHRKGQQVGLVTCVRKTDSQIYVQADLSDDIAWWLVEIGWLRGLSVGPADSVFEATRDGAHYCTRGTMAEVSIVPTPANADRSARASSALATLHHLTPR